MKNLPVFRALMLVLLLPGLSLAADFPYKNYGHALSQQTRAGAMFNGITATALDYSALARQASQPDSAFPASQGTLGLRPRDAWEQGRADGLPDKRVQHRRDQDGR
jgi:hypothetical protein